MELNINFNKKIKPLINSSKELSDWFERNQEMMAHLELTHPGCLHFEDAFASNDVKVLGRMANGCLSNLETTLPCSKEEKVQNAILAIAMEYEKAIEAGKNDPTKDISDVAKEKYYISAEGLKKEESTGMKR